MQITNEDRYKLHNLNCLLGRDKIYKWNDSKGLDCTIALCCEGIIHTIKVVDLKVHYAHRYILLEAYFWSGLFEMKISFDKFKVNTSDSTLIVDAYGVVEKGCLK